MNYGAGCVVFNEVGQVLAVKSAWHGGWSLPFGKVDKGEAIRVAAIRETLEETGIAIELLSNMPIYVAPAGEALGSVFIAKALSQELIESDEGEPAWIDEELLYTGKSWGEWNRSAVTAAKWALQHLND